MQRAAFNAYVAVIFLPESSDLHDNSGLHEDDVTSKELSGMTHC
jgi:hypothetical protein